MKSAKKLLAALAAGLAVVVVAIVVTDPFGSPASANALRPDDAALIARGEKIYQGQCAACHGARLEGQPDWRSRGADGLLPAPPHDASGHTWHHPDETLFRITKFGVVKAANLTDYKSAMPIYDGVLSDEEIVAALSWIKSRWPAAVREKHDQINEQSQRAPK